MIPQKEVKLESRYGTAESEIVDKCGLLYFGTRCCRKIRMYVVVTRNRVVMFSRQVLYSFEKIHIFL